MFSQALKHPPIWVFQKPQPEWCGSIIKEFNLHPVTAQILVSRGFKNLEKIHKYLYAKLPQLFAPNKFMDMEKAVKRIAKTLKNNENILIYGDNDVDGITGTSLLLEFFHLLGVNVFYYVPSRNLLKQSIIIDALEFALKNTCTLLITVDCGITAAKEIAAMVEANIDVIITDHHEPTDRIPHCIATLNPKLYTSNYPNRDITGVGVAFKLAHAITNYLVSTGKISATKIDLKRFLELVALGTVADMGSLQGENRILVRYGLKQLGISKRIGLIKLIEICNLHPSTVTTSDISSKIAPRVNSLGRISDPSKGIELLLVRDDSIAKTLAQELNLNNIERQKIERKDSADIEKYIYTHPEILSDKAIILYSNKWHPGIIPIIAARITKQYHRPTIIIAVDQGIGKGSIRTIPAFPLLQTLHENKDLLINFGGHDYAAGLSIKEENILLFKKRFLSTANQILHEEHITPKIYLDGYISFQEITFDFLESLHLLEPYGIGNPPPLLYCDVMQIRPPKIIGKSHLKFYLEQGGRMLEGIGFGLADHKPILSKKNLKLQIVFTPQVNVFLNNPSIQLLIKDFKVIKE